MSKLGQPLVNAVCGLVVRATSGPPEVARREAAMTFSYAELEHGLTLSRAEANVLREAVELVAEQYPCVGRKTIAAELKKVCCLVVKQGGSRPHVPVTATLERIAALNLADTKVFVEVAGCQLDVAEWKFGGGSFVSATHPSVVRAAKSIRLKDGSRPEPPTGSRVLFRTKVAGAEEYAREQAVDHAQRVLDALQVLLLPFNQGILEDSVTGFRLSASEPSPFVSRRTWLLTSSGPTWTAGHDWAANPATGASRLRLGDATRDRLRQHGVRQIELLLGTASLGQFDENLISSMTWMAHGIRETDAGRKFLNFFIGLEALFLPDDGTPRFLGGYRAAILPVPESVAVCLSAKPKQRVKICEHVKNLVRIRNLIVHRGFTSVESSALIHLANVAFQTWTTLLKKRARFKTPNSFSEWLQLRKSGSR